MRTDEEVVARFDEMLKEMYYTVDRYCEYNNVDKEKAYHYIAMKASDKVNELECADNNNETP